MKIILYISAIIAANLITAAVAPAHIAGLIVPAGSWLIGLTFILRDWVQHEHGRKVTYLVIGTALFLSGICSILLNDGLQIVLASAAAFLISETTDTEVYTRLNVPVHLRVFWSGVAGGILDSVVFVLISGFPPQAIIGQAVVKVILQAIGAAVLKWRRA